MGVSRAAVKSGAALPVTYRERPPRERDFAPLRPAPLERRREAAERAAADLRARVAAPAARPRAAAAVRRARPAADFARPTAAPAARRAEAVAEPVRRRADALEPVRRREAVPRPREPLELLRLEVRRLPEALRLPELLRLPDALRLDVLDPVLRLAPEEEPLRSEPPSPTARAARLAALTAVRAALPTRLAALLAAFVAVFITVPAALATVEPTVLPTAPAVWAAACAVSVTAPVRPLSRSVVIVPPRGGSRACLWSEYTSVLRRRVRCFHGCRARCGTLLR